VIFLTYQLKIVMRVQLVELPFQFKEVQQELVFRQERLLLAVLSLQVLELGVLVDGILTVEAHNVKQEVKMD